MSKTSRNSESASLRRMIEDKIELERSFGVEVVSSRPSEPVESTPSPVAQPVKASPVEVSANASKAERLAALRQKIAECGRCPLATTRTNLVFGDGNPEARLMFVGEAPGADEDAQGVPFVGGGQLLNRMIVAMGLKREEVYIANILKCRPPGNRPPRPEEVIECIGALKRQIAIIHPEVLVALGGVAAQNLLQTQTPVGHLRGQWHEYEGVPLRVTFHPAYLLRSPNEKVKTWEDMKIVLQKLGLPVPK